MKACSVSRRKKESNGKGEERQGKEIKEDEEGFAQKKSSPSCLIKPRKWQLKPHKKNFIREKISTTNSSSIIYHKRQT